jgi:hypothetical protein
MRDKFTLVRWLSLTIYFAYCVLVFFAENTRWWALFGLVSSLLLCFDLYVLTPQPKLSLLHPSDDAKPKFRPTLLTWSVFALLFIGCAFSDHVRLSALLMMMSALCLAVYDQYRITNSDRVART